MNHEQAIKQLIREGYPVEFNPDLNNVLYSVSDLMPTKAMRMQERYWELRKQK